ncbi:MAG TPA: hypothetical protein DCW58_04000 [Candidatus Pacebacteria bacterium]|nr:hypothetical protein [Candidatus Paceibacterota bacterium]
MATATLTVSTKTPVVTVATATPAPTKTPVATATTIVLTKAVEPKSKQSLPAGLNVQVPLTGNLYKYDPVGFSGWDMICEGTQSFTGNTHIIKVNPSKEDWERLSCWAYPPTDEATRNQLAIQFAGDKVRNWESAKVDPLPISITFEDGRVLDLAPGEIPDAYNLPAASVHSFTPFALNIQGIKDGDIFIASIGAVDEWTYIKYVNASGKTVEETFFGTRENVSYKSVESAWRLPGSWTEEKALAFKP